MDTILKVDVGGNITELTNQINDYNKFATITLLDTDKLYLGSVLPFSNRYFRFNTANTQNTVLSFRYWQGNDWQSVSRSLDETNGLNEEGYITWFTSVEASWLKDDTKRGSSVRIPELQNIEIYNQFWLEITPSITTDEMVLWLGYFFANETDFGRQYPDLNRAAVKEAFESGKTTWDDQLFDASQMVINDLLAMGDLNDPSTILNQRQLKYPTLHKTAAIIFNGLGDDYNDDYDKAEKRYSNSLDAGIYVKDVNMNAREDDSETQRKPSRFTR